MKRLFFAAGIALAVGAAHAQQAPAASAPGTSHQEAEAGSGPVPHRHPMMERGKHPGDPPVIDHSMDTLIVEPTRSSITVISTGPTLVSEAEYSGRSRSGRGLQSTR
jgi:hypothetical protein